MSEAVLVSEHALANGRVLAHLELNVPSTLNSLSLNMVRLMSRALAQWRRREDIVVVVITAQGDKAFCAGGDIQALYHAIVVNHQAGSVVDTYPFDFFAEEYRLDYTLHTYPKPIVTLGHGIVMGGGLGILGASHIRVLTEKTRLALPEITIGLFPDAGASWTLRNMPRHYAAFLGYTGSQIQATDGIKVGMGTHCIAHDSREDFVQALTTLPWGDEAKHNQALVEDWLDQRTSTDMPGSQLEAVPGSEQMFTDLAVEAQSLKALKGKSDWIDRGLGNFERGCPTTAGIVFEQLRRVPEMSLAQTFQMELCVATHCALNHDFKEGVRALLIDKDNQPAWQYADIEQLDWSYVLSHFELSPNNYWDVHPLADL